MYKETESIHSKSIILNPYNYTKLYRGRKCNRAVDYVWPYWSESGAGSDSLQLEWIVTLLVLTVGFHRSLEIRRSLIFPLVFLPRTRSQNLQPQWKFSCPRWMVKLWARLRTLAGPLLVTPYLLAKCYTPCHRELPYHTSSRSLAIFLYLNDTHPSLSPLSKTLRPRHKGFETSISTLTRKKSPSIMSPICSEYETRPIDLLNSIAVFQFKLLTGRPCSCIPNLIFENFKFRTVHEPSYFCKRTKCLSKVHGSLAKTRSASLSTSKTKRIVWLPTTQIWNPSCAFHRGLEVRPMASTFKTLG